MTNYFISANSPEDWKPLLSDPGKHLRTGDSAKALAYSRQEADGFPSEVNNVFRLSGTPIFRDIEMLVAFPEYKVPLPGGIRASQNDIFILANGGNQLVSFTAEGKVDEPFGKLVSE